MRFLPQTKTKKLVAAILSVPLAAFGVVALGSGVAVADDSETVNAAVPCQDLVMPIDEDATTETVNLFQNMYYSAGDIFLYGRHQDQANNRYQTWTAANHNYGTSATYAGYGSNTPAIYRYPAVFGWQIGHYELKNDVADWGSAQGTGRPPAYANSRIDAQTGGTNAKFNVTGSDGYPTSTDGLLWTDQVQYIAEEYSWGGITTLSVHSVNPVTYGVYDYNLYKPGTWTDHSSGTATSMVLPGGELNARYQSWLDSYIDFNDDLTAANGGTPIPILLRPYHEHSGDWFWWGIDDMERGWRPAEIQEYVDLWQYTVDYFRDHGVHNFLYVISPDRSRLGEPSYFYSDLVEDPSLEALIDLYINYRWPSGTTRTAVLNQWTAIKAEVADSAFGPTSAHWNEPFFLNFAAVPLDLNPTTGAPQANVSTEFDSWFVPDAVTGNSKFDDFYMRKWMEGFPGADYVDVYGLDNYWENGAGHSYHPYRNQTAKIQEMFAASLNAMAKLAREDGKLISMAESGLTSSVIIDQIINGNPARGFDEKYPYVKYTSYNLGWVINQFPDSSVTQALNHPNFRWVLGPQDPNFETAENLLPDWYNVPVGCFQQSGDIEVDLEVPEYLGGLGLEFSSSSLG
ncbi:MAG: glycoside hydrolase family 26 protein, partial [Propionibacteriaceae bacterium]|nr:glycoside hydrolase family 26 protein [Propionibacteriaceae bacterium]